MTRGAAGEPMSRTSALAEPSVETLPQMMLLRMTGVVLAAAEIVMPAPAWHPRELTIVQFSTVPAPVTITAVR